MLQVVSEEDTRDPAPGVPAWSKMSEEEAKKAWFAKRDAPAWGRPSKMSEEQAKQQWFAKQDVPAWGPSAPEVAAAPQMEQPPADLSSEEEAKKAWFAKQDGPTWGKTTEEQAKQQWLAAREADASMMDQLRERHTRDQAADVPAWEETEVTESARACSYYSVSR